MNAADVMDNVVTELVDAMEAGAGDWHMPWRNIGATGGWPMNAVTRNRYSGGNVVALSLTASLRGYHSPRWATFKQWQSVGAQVRKGERGTHCLYWNVKPAETITETDEATGEEVTLTTAASVRWARAFVVFNADQVDNDPNPAAAPTLTTLERDQRAEAFFDAVPASIRWGEGGPCYRPYTDQVLMPVFDAFDSTNDAYGTLAHELGHWTGHTSRLGRTFGKRFGDHAYAAEELVAELSAAFTCALLGLDTVARTDHAAYLAHWCQMLKAQPAILWTVAAKSQAATDHLAAYSGHPAETADAPAERVA